MHDINTIYNILTLYKENLSQNQISKKVGVTRSCVKYNILKFNEILSKTNENIYVCLAQAHFLAEKIKIEEKISKDKMEEALKLAANMSHFIELLDLNPENKTHRRKVHEKINFYKLDISKLGKIARKKCKHWSGDIKDLFVDNSLVSSGTVKNHLLKNYKQYLCEECGICEWNNKNITLELHHVNGINTDNRLENLQILCPNCHSQTKNFKTKKKYS